VWQQVISALATPAASAEMSGTFFFKQPESFYDIKVEFQSSEATKALLLQWETSINTRTVAKSVIPTFRLFFQAHSGREPQSLTVQPAIACATQCVFPFVLPLSRASWWPGLSLRLWPPLQATRQRSL
jgi:hypothetical protein